MTGDQLYKMAANARLSQDPFVISALGLLTARAHVVKWNVPADHFIFSVYLTPFFFSESWFIEAMAPANPKDEEVKNGFIGSYRGMKVYIDKKGRLKEQEVAVLSEWGSTRGYLAERCVYKARVP